MKSELLVRIKRLAIGALVLSVFALVVVVGAWSMVFHYAEPGEMLVIVSMQGDTPPPGQLIAKDGQKGPLADVLGEGRHFIWPVLYEVRRYTLREEGMEIPPLKIGIVNAKVGTLLTPGRILANPGERGIQRSVLPPGRHRLNPIANKVTIVDATVVEPGFVGFVTRLVGKEPAGRFADVSKDEKGILKEVLQPGIYYVNPHEFRVDRVEVGLNQVSFLGDEQITFPSADAFDIALDATVEWELEPASVAQVMDEFGARREIEEKVLVTQSRSIGRLEGSRYGAKDFLLGEAREKVQNAFTDRLTKKCAEKHVKVHSAYIRHIKIPEKLLVPIRQSFVAKEIEQTAVVQQSTKKSKAILEREERLVEFQREQVRAETIAMVAQVKAETTRAVAEIVADTRRLVAEKQREIAKIEAQRTEVLGRAKAEVQKLMGAAAATQFEFEVAAFGGDAEAFARYAFAIKLRPDLDIRLVQTGEGTFWTDMKTATGQNALFGKILEDARRARKPKPKPRARTR